MKKFLKLSIGLGIILTMMLSLFSMSNAATQKPTIGQINYTTAPLKVGENENVDVTLTESSAINVSRSYWVEVCVVKDGLSYIKASKYVTIPAKKSSVKGSFGVSFSSSGQIYTKINVYSAYGGYLLTQRQGKYPDTIQATSQSASRTYASIKNAVKNKGYSFFETGNYNLNIIGVRNKTNTSDSWNDWLYVLYKESGKEKMLSFSNFTTDPGTYYLQHPESQNPKGCAILVPGQYKGVYKIGLHKNQYKALVQTGGRVNVYRDNNKNALLDMLSSTIDNGNFGINIHHGSGSSTVGKNSAGCQVFKNSSDLTKVLELCEKSKNVYGNSFTYTLLNETDIK